MRNLNQLLLNEFIKLFTRVGTWVMTALVPLFAIAVGILCQHTSEEELHVNNVWQFMDLILTAIPNLMDIVTLFTIIVAAGIVASEFSGGTIKMLLIRPFSRSMILLSKYGTVLLYGLGLILLLLVSAFLTGGLLFGFSGASELHAGTTLTQSGYVWQAVGYSIIEWLVMVTLAFMFSSVFRASSMAIGISLFVLLTGAQLAYVLKPFAWSKFLLFANTNLLLYIDGRPLMASMSLSFSLIMLACYQVLFLGLAWFVFAKRDVAN
ncbi:ABC transporter permease [Paenibacillus roseipurpureus]|uniref:ABC transporter permease n=1 Tax=Paenibacillus roseopurpureus TaxID=2918901 RepID=A0AA96RIP3_9BACL|nr:ABC transporter permease [Paenibacillus sp. MBLB1832]WNR44523.1 ABC transporter permease [Paenibacillus sp. MBLB1832]